MKRRIVATTSSYPNCNAEITVKRNSVKKYANNVYLKNNQEFELLLRNNTQATVVATISMNGKRISTSGVVLKPGQKVYLERYLDENKKFLFETYEVDNTKEALQAIANNGNIEVKFYKEKEVPQGRLDYYLNYPSHRVSFTGQSGNSNNVYTGATAFFNQNATTTNYSKGISSFTTNSVSLDSVETGMVGKGSDSNQEFRNYVGDFETLPFKTVNIKILPFSAKPTEVSDLAVYCTNCGTKNKKGNYKYCPKCGTKFE